MRRPPTSTLFPYTTLFRSAHRHQDPTASTRWHSTPTCRSYRSEEHTSELQSQSNLVCRLLLEKKKPTKPRTPPPQHPPQPLPARNPDPNSARPPHRLRPQY